MYTTLFILCGQWIHSYNPKKIDYRNLYAVFLYILIYMTDDNETTDMARGRCILCFSCIYITLMLLYKTLYFSMVRDTPPPRPSHDLINDFVFLIIGIFY